MTDIFVRKHRFHYFSKGFNVCNSCFVDVVVKISFRFCQEGIVKNFITSHNASLVGVVHGASNNQIMRKGN